MSKEERQAWDDQQRQGYRDERAQRMAQSGVSEAKAAGMVLVWPATQVLRLVYENAGGEKNPVSLNDMGEPHQRGRILGVLFELQQRGLVETYGLRNRWRMTDLGIEAMPHVSRDQPSS